MQNGCGNSGHADRAGTDEGSTNGRSCHLELPHDRDRSGMGRYTLDRACSCSHGLGALRIVRAGSCRPLPGDGPQASGQATLDSGWLLRPRQVI